MTTATHRQQDHGLQLPPRVREAKVWMVRFDDNVVGPVSLDQIERGMKAGKIPPASELAHGEEMFHDGAWRQILEAFPMLSAPAAEPTPATQPSPSSDPQLPEPAAVTAHRVVAITAEAVTVEPPTRRRPLPAPKYAVAETHPELPKPTVSEAVIPEAIIPEAMPAPEPPPPSFRYPEEPVSIPMRGLFGTLFA